MTGLIVVVTLQHGLGDHAGPRGATLPAHITQPGEISHRQCHEWRPSGALAHSSAMINGA